MSTYEVTLAGGSLVYVEARSDLDAVMKVNVLEKAYAPVPARVVGVRKFQEENLVRTFETGATRDNDENKPDYEGYLSPLVLRAYGAYMLRHQKQADGQMRASDNWKKGIPRDAYQKSMFRHFLETCEHHERLRGYEARASQTDEQAAAHKEALCALLFNVMGYLHELEEGR